MSSFTRPPDLTIDWIVLMSLGSNYLGEGPFKIFRISSPVET